MQSIYRRMPTPQSRVPSPLKQFAQPAYPLLLSKLRDAHPRDQVELKYRSPFECLVAAILLTQSTREAINAVTPALFAQFPTAREMAGANRREIEPFIRELGFFRQKAKQLPLTCRMVVSNYGGEVPDNLMSLTRLPGVARRTANLIMAELFGRTEGVLVDTRVRRVVTRLALASGKSAEAIEKQLMDIVPESDWIEFPHLLIELGDTICSTRNPTCSRCPLKNLCPAAKTLGREQMH